MPAPLLIRALLAALICATAAAVEVRLQSPLATTLEIPGTVAGARVISAEVAVPADAPADLGVGAFVCDRDGHWFQRVLPGALPPGRHRIAVAIGGEPMASEPDVVSWLPHEAHDCSRSGLFFYSASDSRAVLVVDDPRVAAAPAPTIATRRLLGLGIDGLGADDAAHVAAGERWSLRLRPEPFPGNPFDPDEFALDLIVTAPDGGTRRIPGFFLQPMRIADRGDREEVLPIGEGTLCARFRPPVAGRYRLRIEARWAGGATVAQDLPDLVAEGSGHAEYARVDVRDPRFFAVDGRFWWPIGLNLHSPFDLRSEQALGTRLTPDRGSLVYDAMLDRLAAAGGDACEIWMAAWNLALEWRADWPGYRGLGRYSDANAWKLDAILDRAWARGIRVNLVLNNHGQASGNADREWKLNPYNSATGGPVEQAIDLFADPAALKLQERLRRYLVGRFADHPGILGWKLWSEFDLTAARGEVVWRWHEQAAARWHELDTYGHPVTTHWAGDFRRVNPAVAALPGIDYLCIDAYRRANANGSWRLLADILADSTVYPERGLAIYGKPVLTTEFGAGSGAAPDAYRVADHLTGAWAGLVSGHAGAPMLWWFEWVDQNERWGPYGAIRRFVAGEDLRGGRSAALDSEPEELWARAWVEPGRLLGYVLDRRWGMDGAAHSEIAGATIVVGEHVAAGRLRVEWWDADAGIRLAGSELRHAGGRLALAVPRFSRHLAFKIARDSEPGAGAAR